MTDDGPLDLTRVSADDAALDALALHAGDARAMRDDAAIALLRDLLTDVETDLPQAVPVGRGTTVLTLASPPPTDRRRARSGTFVAVLAAGLVSLGGAAAASTLVPAGTPLHGVGDAVRSAAGAVVDAVTPPAAREGRPAGGAAGTAVSLPAMPPTSTPTQPAPTAAAPGLQISAAARSEAAARQVTALLDAADELLADRRLAAADARLNLAERTLAEVLPGAQATALGERLAQLRDAVAQATAESAPESAAEPAAPTAKADPPKREPDARTSDGDTHKKDDAAQDEAEPAREEPRSDAPKSAKPDAADAPQDSDVPQDSRAASPRAPRADLRVAPPAQQSAGDASRNPRA